MMTCVPAILHPEQLGGSQRLGGSTSGTFTILGPSATRCLRAYLSPLYISPPYTAVFTMATAVVPSRGLPTNPSLPAKVQPLPPNQTYALPPSRAIGFPPLCVWFSDRVCL